MKLFNRSTRNSKRTTVPSFITFGNRTDDYEHFSNHMKYLTNSTLASVSRIISSDLNELEIEGTASDFFYNNKVFSKHQLLTSVVRDLIVNGNAYLTIDKRKHAFNYIPAENISNYEYNESSGALEYTFFDPLKQQTYIANYNEMLHFKFLTDSQGLYGISPIDFLDNTLALEYKATTLAVDNLDNSMFSQGVLKIEGQMDDKTKDVLKQNFEKSAKSGQVVVIDDTMEYSKDDSSFRGFDVLSKSRDNVATIAAVFGINPERLGAEQTNSSSKALNKSEGKYIKTYTSIIEDEINAKFGRNDAFQFIISESEVDVNEEN